VLVPRACKFAVRGGGHGAIAGIANIDDGVTIDLGGLSAVTVSSDNKKVKVGGGASWGAVYARLSPLGLAAPGARHATVGVGGSSLGGKSLIHIPTPFSPPSPPQPWTLNPN
jgi:FAD/FMN-containing dehydrogenase